MAMPCEVLFTCEKSGQLWSVCAWDPHTGTSLMSYRGSSAEPRTLCLVRDDYIVNAVSNKPLINVWPMQRKEQTQKKIVCPGKITAMVVSPDGLYCIAAICEKIHVWQLSNGNLLSVLDKHYLTVRCLRFTDDGSHFISGADDNSVLVWSLSKVLALGNTTGNSSKVEPRHSWNDHLLPITDVHIGCGGCRARVVTGSRDKTAKIWDMASGRLLITFTFAAEVTSVITDSADYRLFVGTASSRIYQVNLFDKAVISRAVVEPSADQSFVGHSGPVTCLSLSLDGLTLASGSHDASVRLWTTASRQCIRTIHHTDGVTNVLFTVIPSSLLDSDTPRPAMEFCQLKRHLVTAEENVGSDATTTNVVSIRPHGKRTWHHVSSSTLPTGIDDPYNGAAGDVAVDKNAAIEELDQAKRTNKELYLFAVNKLLNCN